MTLQNRVTPFGEIVAIPQRGMLTGNRGIIHDPATKTLLNRRWTSKAWLVCLCDFKGRHREVMGGRSWTELFFLDEAVALAAGHRPCFFCRRDAALSFSAAWADGKGIEVPTASEMDSVLHGERIERGHKKIHAFAGPVSELPDGAFVVSAGEAFAVVGGLAFRWTASGYLDSMELSRADGLLTPPSTLQVLRAGYRPVLHPDLLGESGAG